MTGVAAVVASEDYSTNAYEQLFDSILYLCRFERSLFDKMDQKQRDNLHARLLLTMADLEEEVDRNKQTLQLDRLYADIREDHAHLEVRDDFIEPETPEYSKASADGPDMADQKTKGDAYRMSMGISRKSVRTKLNSGPFYDLIHVLVIVLADLSAGTMLLSDVLGISRKPDFADFKLFLQTLEAFGSGYQDDIDVNNYKRRDT